MCVCVIGVYILTSCVCVCAQNFLEKRYNEEMELDDAVHTALLTLREGFEGCVFGVFRCLFWRFRCILRYISEYVSVCVFTGVCDHGAGRRRAHRAADTPRRLRGVRFRRFSAFSA